MGSFVSIQHWLYGGMASGLREVAGGDLRAIFVVMAAAVLFGAVHALMPGHGKTVLVSITSDSQLSRERGSPMARSSR